MHVHLSEGIKWNAEAHLSEPAPLLSSVVTKLVNRGYQPHLEDFLLRINFNNYYKDSWAGCLRACVYMLYISKVLLFFSCVLSSKIPCVSIEANTMSVIRLMFYKSNSAVILVYKVCFVELLYIVAWIFS